MTRDEAVAVWAILGSCGSGAALDEATLGVRAELILDLDAATARDAAVALARSARWTPSVAEFREAVLAPGLPTPDEVWEEVRGLVSARGWISPPCQHDCSLEAWRVIQVMGWEAICEGREVDNRAHIIKQVAPGVIERRRQELLAGPAVSRPALTDGDRPLVLPDLRLPE